MNKTWLFLVILVAVEYSNAESQYSPDYASEYVWRENNIALVRIENGPDSDAKVPVVELKAEQIYNGTKTWTDKTVPTSCFWFGERYIGKYVKPIIVDIKKGDLFLICQPRNSNTSTIKAVKITVPVAESPLLRAVSKISEIRDAGTELIFKDNVSSKDNMVAKYCLEQLTKMKSDKADASFSKQLIAVRDDISRPLDMRIPANRLLLRYSTTPEDTRLEVSRWPCLAFESATESNTSLSDLYELSDEIDESIPKREDRAEYYIKILQDTKKTKAIRLASLHALGDGRMFDYNEPTSGISSKIYTTVVSLLDSDDTSYRRAGAGMLHTICNRIIARQKQIVCAKDAILAIDKAIKKEKDKDTLEYLNGCVSLLNFILTRDFPVTGKNVIPTTLSSE